MVGFGDAARLRICVCEPMSSVCCGRPELVTIVHESMASPCLIITQGKDGRVMTSPQASCLRPQKSECNGDWLGVNQTARGACLNHLSESFASVDAKQTIQELVRPVDDTGDVEASPG